MPNLPADRSRTPCYGGLTDETVSKVVRPLRLVCCRLRGWACGTDKDQRAAKESGVASWGQAVTGVEGGFSPPSSATQQSGPLTAGCRRKSPAHGDQNSSATSKDNPEAFSNPRQSRRHLILLWLLTVNLAAIDASHFILNSPLSGLAATIQFLRPRFCGIRCSFGPARGRLQQDIAKRRPAARIASLAPTSAARPASRT